VRAEQISRAVVHGRTVIDRPRDVIFYGVCPTCTGDIWQERVDPHDRDARIVCPRGCGYTVPYAEHEQAALDAGEDRWLTLDELVGAIHSAGEVVSRKQILRWVEREGLPREQRARPQLVGGEIQSVEVDVYRLGDVRQLAADAETDRKSLTTSQVANLLGVSEAAVRKMVERGTLVPNRPGAKPLRFTREALGNDRSA
jgi:excisionase family DNA binding protein